VDGESKLPVFYINGVNVEVSVYDFILNCGLRTVEQKEPSPLVKIVMSPQHAKVLASLLTNSVNQYEKDLGELPLPPEFKSPKTEVR
jgi:hypothetical protein